MLNLRTPTLTPNLKNNFKKLKKLKKNPNMFFRDYFEKRLKDSSHLEMKKKILENKKILNNNEYAFNYTEKLEDEIELLLINLIQRTCFIQIIPTATPNAIRVACKETDFNYIKKCIKEYENNGYKIIVKEEKLMSTVYLKKGDVIFKNIFIELDPWYINNTHIYTKNWNPLITHIEREKINQTVYAYHPYFLQQSPNINDIYLAEKFNYKKSLYNDIDFPIDIVYTWVDGNDKNWKEKKNKFQTQEYHHENIANNRYEQIDEIKYSLRSLYYNFKNIRNIYIVTDNQIPEWLDPKNELITIIDHKLIFKNQNHLPTFNSHSIETNLHNIPNLSEHFIYMNDDLFIWNPINADVFFTSNGLTKIKLEKINNVNDIIYQDAPAWKNAAINGNKIIYELTGKISYSYHEHVPFALNKNVIQEIWKEFPEIMELTSSSKFRSHTDISPLSFFYHCYAFAKKQAVLGTCKNVTLNTSWKDCLTRLKNALNDNTLQFLCLNDGNSDISTKISIIEILDKKFPNKAPWEL